ncbi:MAG: spore coat associated protein CotJA [Lachnospiraceae bacterium]|nr:spore coat associated protein CotJA [Lachnospiraceae bacterium]
MSMPRPERPDPDDFPIGMGYVPMQKWRDLYPMEKGFMEGTIFMELNRIFCGKRGNRA